MDMPSGIQAQGSRRSQCLNAIWIVIMIPVDIGVRIFRPRNGTARAFPTNRSANPPISDPIWRINPFDMADSVGDAAKPCKTLPFDGMLKIAAAWIVCAPQPHPSAGKQLRGIPPSFGVEFAFRHLVQ